MQIQVLGTGCAKCKLLYGEVEKAIAASGRPVQLTKVERIDEIMKFGVPMTPALVVDGEVKVSGRVAKSAEILSWIMTAAAKSSA
jgi:small redox-active disulfide protein 2